MNNPKPFLTSNSQEWETPWWLIKAIERKHGIKYLLDIAATRDNRRAPMWIERGENLEQYEIHKLFIEACCTMSNSPLLFGKSPYEYSQDSDIRDKFHIWCNPPYGDKEFPVKWWAEIALRLAAWGANTTMLLPTNKFDQKWFEALNCNACIEFITGRVQFTINGKRGKNSNTQGSVLIHMGPRWQFFYGQWRVF